MKTVADLKAGDKIVLFDYFPRFLEGVIESISLAEKRSFLQIQITGKYQKSLLDARINVRQQKALELLNNDTPLSIYGVIALKEDELKCKT